MSDGKIRRVNWERAKALSGWVIAAILASSLGGIVLATNPSFNTMIQPGTNVVQAAFILFNSSSVYYARNGNTGAIDYSGAVFDTVFASALSAAPSSSTIFLKAGRYTVASTLTINKAITIRGEGIGTEIDGNGVPAQAILISHSQVIIRDMHLYGSASKTGILIQNYQEIAISGVWMDTFSKGIDSFSGSSKISITNSYFSSMGYGVRLGGGNTIVVSNNALYTMSQVAIELDNSMGAVVANNVIVDGVQKQFFGAITLDATSGNGVGNSTVVGNTIRFTAAQSVDVNGILLDAEASPLVFARDISVSSNAISGGSYSHINVGIYLHGWPVPRTVENVSIVGNTVDGFALGISVTQSANVTVGFNSLRGNTAALSAPSSWNTLAMGNAGYNPQPWANVAPTGSPYNYTNNDPYIEDICVYSGTVSQIDFMRYGKYRTTALTSGCFELNPLDHLIVTYSSTPTLTKIPH